MTVLSLLICLQSVILWVSASITIYNPSESSTTAIAVPTPCIGAIPCDGNVSTSIEIPAITAPQSVSIQLFSDEMPQMQSMPVSGNFFGFSLEISIADQLFGDDGNKLNPIFLNLMSTIISRGGEVFLRIGGDAQESAVVVPGGLLNDTGVETTDTVNGNTSTTTLLISPSLIYAMGNISSLLNVKWFLGVPFNDTKDPSLTLAEIGQRVLGENLVGLQLGNEPDLYSSNGLRSQNYTPEQYTAEWGTVLQYYLNDTDILDKSLFVAPSVCCGGPGKDGWTMEDVFNTGFLTEYSKNLAYISAQQYVIAFNRAGTKFDAIFSPSYPTNNCNLSQIPDRQTLLPQFFLNHSAVIALSWPYVNSSQISASMNKPFIMFESNSASCGGLSDSFAAAMWAIDYSLSMAYFNFSNALFRVGGMNDYSNPFTPPATNQSDFRQWTVAPTFYSALVVAEALGASGKAQVTDLLLNDNSDYSPGYVIYEDGKPERLVLINYLTDPTGANNYTAYISIGGNDTGSSGNTPTSVRVKYLISPSSAEKFVMTWAGQTFGGPFQSDGRLQGEEQFYTFACDTENNVCAVPVGAPSVAVVFLSSQALSESEPTTTRTFATTTTSSTTSSQTGDENTATVEQAVLATSNGRGGGNWGGLGATSPGSSNSASLNITPSFAFYLEAFFGWCIVLLLG